MYVAIARNQHSELRIQGRDALIPNSKPSHPGPLPQWRRGERFCAFCALLRQQIWIGGKNLVERGFRFGEFRLETQRLTVMKNGFL